MLTVIKLGTPEIELPPLPERFRGECKVCGCQFVVDAADVKVHLLRGFYDNPLPSWGSSFHPCPMQWCPYQVPLKPEEAPCKS